MVADFVIGGLEGGDAARAETGDGGIVGGEQDAGEVEVLYSCGVCVGDVPVEGKGGMLVSCFEVLRGTEAVWDTNQISGKTSLGVWGSRWNMGVNEAGLLSYLDNAFDISLVSGRRGEDVRNRLTIAGPAVRGIYR